MDKGSKNCMDKENYKLHGPMINEITSLELENEKLKNILRKVFPEKSGHLFICGESGEKDSMGLPDRLFVCPAYGLDGFAVYKKDRDYDAPGW
jgi:hypothetical protein